MSRGGDTLALPSMKGDVWAPAIGGTQALPSHVESREGSSGGEPKDGASMVVGDELGPAIRGRVKRDKIESGSGRVLWRAAFVVGGVVAVALIAILVLKRSGTSQAEGNKAAVERSIPPAPVRSAAKVTAPDPATARVPAIAESATVLVHEADGSHDRSPATTSRSKRRSARARKQETGDSDGQVGRPGRPTVKQTMESSRSTYPAVGRASDSDYPAME